MKRTLERRSAPAILLATFAACGGTQDEAERTAGSAETTAADATSGDEPSEGSTGDAELTTSSGHGSSDSTSGNETTSGGEDSTGAAETCGARDECRTEEDCAAGQYCDDCSCCDPEILVCGTRPPPGGVYCEDDPDTMFLCLPWLECCGSKNACYDPIREPDFCPR